MASPAVCWPTPDGRFEGYEPPDGTTGMTALVAVLGAGAGSRMGGGKLHLDLGGRPLGMWAVSVARELSPSVVFIASAGALVWSEAPLPQAEVVHNLDAASGMASSLALAAHIAAERAVSSLLVTLADMPFVSLETLRVLVAETDPGGISACRYPGGRLGPPACFGGQRLGALTGLTGDTGARHLLNQPGFAQGIAVPERELVDIDTLEDLERARGLMRR